ncbi:MAG: hypothetical protein KKB30_17265, partial [Proteobacteria bacterium]|nr:hypothetical protein [Pseudomonadota bacterium]
KKEYKTTSFVLKDLKLSESEEELFDKLEQFRELDLVLNGEDGGLEKRGYVKYEGRDPFRQ